MPLGTLIRWPRWSPDGAYVTFRLDSLRFALATLLLLDPVSSQTQPIARPEIVGEDQSFGAWTKDARYFVFAAGSPEMHDLWAVSSPTRSQRPDLVRPLRVTNGPMNWVWPTPGNTTGELYAFGETRRGELVQLLPGTGEWRPYPDGIPAYELDFSRDGQWVAYIHYPDHRLWIARVHGSERIQLSWPDFEAHQPHWSPDGTRIAFMGKPGDRWRVMIVDVATDRGQEPIPDGADQGVPTWLTDRRLVFGDWPTGDPRQVMKLHVFDVQHREAAIIAGSARLWTARCSPGGKYLAALRQDSKVLLISRWGSPGWRQVLSAEYLDGPTWSSDSRHIYLTNSGANRRELLSVDALSGSVEKVADIRNFPDTAEQWFGVAPDGSPLALRSVRVQEIYALRWRP